MLNAPKRKKAEGLTFLSSRLDTRYRLGRTLYVRIPLASTILLLQGKNNIKLPHSTNLAPPPPASTARPRRYQMYGPTEDAAPPFSSSFYKKPTTKEATANTPYSVYHPRTSLSRDTEQQRQQQNTPITPQISFVSSPLPVPLHPPTHPLHLPFDSHCHTAALQI